VITTLPHDTLLGASEDFSKRVARNIQILLREESHLGHVVDPAGGCWHLETLTDELCEKGWQVFQAVEAQGGMIAALQNGWARAQVDAVQAQAAKRVATRRQAVTGVSEYPLLDKKMPEVTPIDLKALLSSLPQDNELVDPPATDAAKLDAFPMRRSAEPFERLRDASDAHREKTGARPRLFLANLGSVASHTARATFASNLFSSGGIEPISNSGFKQTDVLAKAFKDSGAKAAVICGTDDAYQSEAVDTAKALKAAGAVRVILAGRMGENEDAWRDAGIDSSIYLGCNALDILRDLLRDMEVQA
jgi:methylmalonyl-CoA mutase